MAQPALGEAPGRKAGPLVVISLVILAVIAGAILMVSRSRSASKALILAPDSPSVTCHRNGTVSLGVAVRGDVGAGLTWKIEERNGGQVEAAGVTAQGQDILYKATYHAPARQGDYHVVAASSANRESSATIAVHVTR